MLSCCAVKKAGRAPRERVPPASVLLRKQRKRVVGDHKHRLGSRETQLGRASGGDVPI